MKQVIILHDAFSNPTQAWYQSIESIIPRDYTLVTPELPIGAEQGMSFWLKAIEPYLDNLNKDTIIITHGLSSLLALRIFERIEKPVRMYISVAGCFQKPNHKVFSPIAGTFLGTPFHWTTIQRTLQKVIHIWNAKDPYIEPFLSENLAQQLPGKNVPLLGENHFNEENEPLLSNEINSLFRELEIEDYNKQLAQEQHAEQARREELAKSLVPGIITFDTAKAQSIAGYQGSVISELLSEARIQDEIKKTKSAGSTKNIFYLIGTFIFVIIGIGLLGYALYNYIPQQVVPTVRKNIVHENSILRPDTNDLFEISGQQSFELLKNFNALKSKEIPTKTIHSIVPVQGNQLVTFDNFLNSLSIMSPIGFSTKIEDYTYGYYQPEDSLEKIPFLLVKFNGYGIMQTLMNNWEPTIIFETRTLFQKEIINQTLLKPESVPFRETITKNIFLRTATLSTGETLYYGFLSDTLLFISPSDQIAEPLLRRIIGR